MPLTRNLIAAAQIVSIVTPPNLSGPYFHGIGIFHAHLRHIGLKLAVQEKDYPHSTLPLSLGLLSCWRAPSDSMYWIHGRWLVRGVKQIRLAWREVIPLLGLAPAVMLFALPYPQGWAHQLSLLNQHALPLPGVFWKPHLHLHNCLTCHAPPGLPTY
jgi:hypothetical protein